LKKIKQALTKSEPADIIMIISGVAVFLGTAWQKPLVKAGFIGVKRNIPSPE
jgi:hypothetical protein